MFLQAFKYFQYAEVYIIRHIINESVEGKKNERQYGKILFAWYNHAFILPEECPT